MKTPALVRATLRGTTWISTDGLRELASRNRLWVLPLAALGILAFAGAFQFLLVGTFRNLLAVGLATGHPELPLFYAFLGAWAFVFVTSVPLALSVLYYSGDIRLLLVLPVRTSAIVGAKLALLYLYGLPVHLFFSVSAVVLYVRRTGWCLEMLLALPVTLLIGPLAPVCLAVLFVTLLMKPVDLSRFRVAVEMTGMALAVVLAIGMQVLLSRATVSLATGGEAAGFPRLPDLYGALARAFPPAAWTAEAYLRGAGPAGAFRSLLIGAAALAAALLLVPLNFLREVTESGVKSGRRKGSKDGTRGSLAYLLRPGSRRMRMVRREWSIIASSSTFLFESIGELLILPLLLGIYALILPRGILEPVMGFIAATPYAGLIFFAVLVLMTNLTTVSATSISREGKLFAVSLTMPVSGREQVGAKLAFQLLLFYPAYLLDLAIVYAVFRLPPVHLLYLVPGGLLFQVFGFCSGIFFDLRRPFLRWTHPQQAMKSNTNAVGGMGPMFALCLLLGGLGFLALQAGVDPFLLGCLAVVLAAILDLVFLPMVMKYADRQYGGGLEIA